MENGKDLLNKYAKTEKFINNAMKEEKYVMLLESAVPAERMIQVLR